MKPLPPIYSRYDDDPDHRDAIERFIVGLGEWIDELQDLHSEGRQDGLVERSRALAVLAAEVGFPGVVEVCEAAADATASGEDEQAQKQLVELTELVQRIRRGSRGAA